MRTEQKIAQLFLDQKKTLALAESCTGGLLANRLTDISGSSGFFWLGIIAYDNKAKTKLLKVPTAIIKKHGAVSPEVATLMAQNVRKILHTDLGIGITGIAGPLGGSKTKPIGLVFISVAHKNNVLTQPFHFKGSRVSIKSQAANKALALLLAALKS